MTATTPDHVLRSVYNNARGIGNGPVVTRKEWQAYAQDLGGWFTYWGQAVDISVKPMGGGLYHMQGTFRN